MLLMATNLRSVRKEQKATQQKLADISGVAYATIKKFESTGIISLESLLKLCYALDRLEEFESVLRPDNLDDKRGLFDV
ncbi:helix-turn-helix transcriptional regulator [Flavobacteriales bacterium AH-315-E23]|nr:helix-turn-helix transcriptional regulator [Flavobacteriales bacterium AH-315-E23]